jgi:hypothetical protein
MHAARVVRILASGFSKLTTNLEKHFDEHSNWIDEEKHATSGMAFERKLDSRFAITSSWSLNSISLLELGSRRSQAC